jgi:hypothetical protein
MSIRLCIPRRSLLRLGCSVHAGRHLRRCFVRAVATRLPTRSSSSTTRPPTTTRSSRPPRCRSSSRSWRCGGSQASSSFPCRRRSKPVLLLPASVGPLRPCRPLLRSLSRAGRSASPASRACTGHFLHASRRGQSMGFPQRRKNQPRLRGMGSGVQNNRRLHFLLEHVQYWLGLYFEFAQCDRHPAGDSLSSLLAACHTALPRL